METTLFFSLVAQVALTMTVWFIMGRRNIKGLKQGHLTASQVKTMDKTGADPYYIVASRNFNNQFELPVLLFVAAIVATQMQIVSMPLVIMSWLFVISRMVHTFIHLTSNKVRYRFYSYLIGGFTLWLLWLVMAITVLMNG